MPGWTSTPSSGQTPPLVRRTTRRRPWISSQPDRQILREGQRFKRTRRRKGRGQCTIGRFYVQWVDLCTIGRFYVQWVDQCTISRFYVEWVDLCTIGRFYIR